MNNLLAQLWWRFRGVRVIALVGKSGTGKSFRARLVMEKHNIDLLIDDGLLIRDQTIVAGKSAKRETASMAAFRTALFTDKQHRREVRSELEHTKFRRLLIIGTSERMVKKITTTLQLPEPSRMIMIEDIATADEIKTAMNHRHVHGRHVIPGPAVEVRRKNPWITTDSIKVIWRRGLGLIRRDKAYEKTVVQPVFSQKGSVSISEAALTQMILHCIAEHSPGIRVRRVAIGEDHRSYGIDIHVAVPFRLELKGSVYSLQSYVCSRIERFSGITIRELNIIIDTITAEVYNDSDGGHE